MASLAVTLSALLFLLAVPPGAAQILDLPAYRQAIQSSLASLQQDPGTSIEVANHLREIDAVRMPDQSTVEPDLTRIVDYLESAPPRISDAEASLSAILVQLDRADSAGMSAERIAAADASLQTILARSEFKPQPKKAGHSIQGWVTQQLGHVLGPIFEPLGRVLAALLSDLPVSRPVWMIGVVIIGMLALVAAIVGPIRGIRRGFGPATARILTPMSDTGVSASELRQAAENLARDNSYRLAIRALYLSALLRLDEQGVLPFDRSLTNREVLRTALARSGSALAERLAPLVERFDQHWYGANSCTEFDYREFAQLATWAWEST